MKWLQQVHWQIVLASVLGLALGLGINSYVDWDPSKYLLVQLVDFIGQLF